MGFVDLVGIASNYVKADLNLTDSQAKHDRQQLSLQRRFYTFHTK
jgi:hypothetical protein